jgi:hypothetical protein
MDDLARLKKLAGINEFKGLQPYGGSNISITGTEKKIIEREQNIQPGTDEWFKLWFSLPKFMGGEAAYIPNSPGFRGRTK